MSMSCSDIIMSGGARCDRDMGLYVFCRFSQYAKAIICYVYRPSALGAPVLPAWKEAPGSPDDPRPLRPEEQGQLAAFRNPWGHLPTLHSERLRRTAQFTSSSW